MGKWASFKMARLIPLIVFAHAMFFFQNCQFTQNSMQSAKSRSLSQKSPTGVSSGNGEPYEGKGGLSVEKIFKLDSLPSRRSIVGATFVRNRGVGICSNGASDYQTLTPDPEVWSYQQSVCLENSKVTANPVNWSPLLYEMAAYDNRIFQTNSASDSIAVIFCSHESDDGKLMLEVSENTVFPELPRYRSAEMNFYQRVIPRDVSFNRADSSDGVASYFNKQGELKFVKKDEPRFEYNPENGRYLGLLIEGTSKNWVPFSHEMEKMSTLPWVSDQWLAPDGTMTADILETSQVSNGEVLLQVNSESLKQKHLTFSFFIKAQGTSQNGSSIYLRWVQIDSTGDRPRAINLVFKNGQLYADDGSSSWLRTRRLKNGWLRVSLTNENFTKQETKLIWESHTFNGDISFWGIQLEELDVSTSLIKTNGRPELRGSDLVDWTVGEWMNSEEGTFLFEWSLNDVRRGIDQHIFTGNGTYDVTVEKSTGSLYNAFVGSNKALDNVKILSSTDYRSAVSYSSNTLRGVHNGHLTQNKAVSALRPGGSYQVGRDSQQKGQFLYGHVKRVSFWDRELDKNQLIDMTGPQRHSSPFSGSLRTTGFNLTFPDDGVETTLLSVVKNQSLNHLEFGSSIYDFQISISNSGQATLKTTIKSVPLILPLYCTVDQ